MCCCSLSPRLPSAPPPNVLPEKGATLVQSPHTLKHQSSFVFCFLSHHITPPLGMYARSAVHTRSTDLCSSRGRVPLSEALSSLEVTLVTQEVLVMLGVPTVWASLEKRMLPVKPRQAGTAVHHSCWLSGENMKTAYSVGKQQATPGTRN